jgi:FAD:protein FMN transferase
MKCFRKQSKLMGSAFELGIVEQDEKKANELLSLGITEIKRIENLLSEFLPDSTTSLINKESGRQKVKIKKEVFDLLFRCQKISELTQGFFDITVGPLKKLYQFKNENFQLPVKKIIQKTLKKTGFQKIELDHVNHAVFLKEKDMHISFAAIGKGYAADAVKKLWLANDVQSGFINASGDLTAFGYNAEGEAWKIGIANPDLKEKILFYVPLNNASAATSGDYEQHFWHEGKRYSHNINPKTGLPLHGIKSVSVFSPSAELSDALATAVYAMGKEKGLSFINQLPQTHAIVISEQNKVSFSKAIAYETVS